MSKKEGNGKISKRVLFEGRAVLAVVSQTLLELSIVKIAKTVYARRRAYTVFAICRTSIDRVCATGLQGGEPLGIAAGYIPGTFRVKGGVGGAGG